MNDKFPYHKMKVKSVSVDTLPDNCDTCQFCDDWGHRWWTCLAIDPEASFPAEIGRKERWHECPLREDS